MDLSGFFQGHMTLVYFVYGLSFFLMGFAIILQVRRYRKDSSLRLGKYLWLLGAFGIFHGLAEWSTMFLMDAKIPKHIKALFFVADNTILGLSFLFLFLFGLWNLPKKYNPQLKWIKPIPFLIFLTWTTIMHPDLLGYGLGESVWIRTSRLFLRYGLAFPGALVSSLALFLQYHELKHQVSKGVNRNFLISSVIMVVYGVLAGLVIRKHPYLPLALITEDNFIKFIGVPVQFFRAFCGVLLLYYIIKGLDVFSEETKQEIERLNKERLLYQERARIGRDLHDGIIQSIYGVGLKLDNVTYLIEENPVEAKVQVKDSMSSLNEIVKDIRQYILALRPANLEDTDLIKGTRLLVERFKASSLIHTDIAVYGEPKDLLSAGECSHYYHILREILNNISKHAKATIIEITLSFRRDGIELMIWDNGIGFDEAHLENGQENQSGEHQGIHNIRERAHLLGGTIKINSWPNRGTIIRLAIPEGRKNDAKN